jgi:methionine-gamma-lyase
MLHPESKMMSFGYDPSQHNGSLKCPIFQTSTFVFPSAEEAKRDFEIAFGLETGTTGYSSDIYSRLGNPNMTLLEKRLAALEESEDAVVFSSGMAAISTMFQTFLRPGDLVLHSTPLYGGTYHYLKEMLSQWGIDSIGYRPNQRIEEIEQMVAESFPDKSPTLIYLETPANPTNELFSIRAAQTLSETFSTDQRKTLVVVDNTYLGPLWQKPLMFGADLVLYSATKFLAGHSDLIAGAITTSSNFANLLRNQRTFAGTIPDAWTCWLITRSLETLKLRMEQQCESATLVAEWLSNHPSVDKVLFPSELQPIRDSQQFMIYRKQCLRPGAVVSFLIRGGEEEAFSFLNNLKMVKIAVSLGSTESLAEHPFTMTHLDLFEAREELGITPNLIRISVGVENIEDLITDLSSALEAVVVSKESVLEESRY